MTKRAFQARNRKRLVFLTAVLLFVFAPMGTGLAVAELFGGQSDEGSSVIDAVAWMGIRDSSGAPLANYRFIQHHPNPLLHLNSDIASSLLGMELVGYMAIACTAIWLIGLVLSFKWLGYMATPLRDMADSLRDQIATPAVLITAATIGAFFVAWFIVRGFHSKATMQIVTMLLLGIIGPVFLANPLENELSSDGLLANSRYLGVEVSSGLLGNYHVNPDQQILGLQAGLADNLVRKPVQIWNFGHVVDSEPACKNAWTTSIATDNGDTGATLLSKCGDGTLARHLSSPSMAQVGTGLLLLISILITGLFALSFAVKIVRSAMESIFHAVAAIFGFAAGGFVYGPTQTYLIRNLVHSFIAAGRMIANIIFLACFMLLITDLLKSAGGQVLPVIALVTIVQMVGITQLGKLDKSLSRGGNWVANRFALATQGVSMGRSAGGSGATAIGMPAGMSVGGGSAAHALRTTAALQALNTVNTSPITAWLAHRTINPLNPLAFGRRRQDVANIAAAPLNRESAEWLNSSRRNWETKGAIRLGPYGINQLGVANALDGLGDSKVPDIYKAAALRNAGFDDPQIIDAQRAYAVQSVTLREMSPYGFLPLQKAVAASMAVDNHWGERFTPAFAAQAVIAADNFSRHSNAPVFPANVDHAFVNRIRGIWDDEAAVAGVTANEWQAANRDTRQAIGNELAVNHRRIAHALYDAVAGGDDAGAEANRVLLQQSARRLSNLHHVHPSQGKHPWS
ncbi:MAG: hypothetical protein J2P18_05750 [Nocardia sp.]|nr:hypothetical protein [Nocardia sp.]